ncbi:MAG TPA: OmpA family protein [Cyclobacteriaceae bacterium]|nr:OmpA family protein [Cyclobacteriaceae bacterium]
MGKIIDATTKEPIRARVYYKSLPYGNIVGLINNSDFQFNMFDSYHYAIQIDASGYEQAKYIIAPDEAIGSTSIERVIELNPVGSGPKDVILLEGLLFEQNRSRITPSSHDALDEVVTMLKKNPTMVIQLEGHTDFRGNPQANMRLSQERVDNVKKYIVSKGIKKNRVITKAFGGTQPLSRDNNDAAMRLNRRVEMRIIQD